MTRFVGLTYILAVLCSLPLLAQEAIYEPPIQIDYDNPNPYECDPVIAFNGTTHAVFYSIEGPGDADDTIYFRPLGRDGKPSGPQVRVFGEQGVDWPIVACHDGNDAFLVAVGNYNLLKVTIVRVDRSGKVLQTREIAEPIDYWFHGPHNGLFNGCFMQVVGKKVIIAFTDRGPFYDAQRAVLIVGPKRLNGDFEFTELPKGDLANSSLIGMSYDNEGFLAMIAQRDRSDYSAVETVRLIRIDFEGNVIGGPIVLEDPVPSSFFMGGPVFNGTGHMFFFSEYFEHQDSFKNYSQIVDTEGLTVRGPTDLGWAGSWITWSSPILSGNCVTSIFHIGPKMRLMMFSNSGTFICDPVFFSEKGYYSGYRPVEAFTGMATTVVFSGVAQGEDFFHVYMNQVGLPPSVNKPQIVFFRSGADYLPDKQRAVIWSATGCSSLKITGKGVKLKNLPAVGLELVKIKGSKLTLKITARGPGGKATKKIILKP